MRKQRERPTGRKRSAAPLVNMDQVTKRFMELKNYTPPLVINVEDENTSIVDLTEGPEVIELDDSIGQEFLKQSKRSRSIPFQEVIDLEPISTSSTTTTNVENDIQIIDVRKRKMYVPSHLSFSTPQRIGNEVIVVNSISKTKQKKRKSIKKKPNTGLLVTVQSNGPRSVKEREKNDNPRHNNGRPGKCITPQNNNNVDTDILCLSSNQTNLRRKTKLQDIGNIPQPNKVDTTKETPQGLTDNVLKYYENMERVIKKVKGQRKKSLKSPLNVSNKNKTVIKKKVLRISKKKKFKKKSRFVTEGSQSCIEAHESTKVKRRSSSSIKLASEMRNVYNPNPMVVDVEGLRPIVIDGSNLAVSHGHGIFSVMGLKICVDYFTKKGHETIKVFLPQYRKSEFSEELMADLNTKCDMVFTPAHCVNGSMKVPYDDRFIIQYATEVGGVVVSTDNYRDLWKENPRWRSTIAQRLLMFTWVDDVLMFPMDPLGRDGPSLDEFLRF